MFTEQSNHNHGGLREINQSPYEPKRIGNAGSSGPQIMIGGIAATRMINPDANQTPNLSKNRMDPINLNFQHSQQ